MKRVVGGLLVLAVLGVAGCATIVSGSRQKVTFNSEPPGATVLVGGIELGKTPVTTRVKRSKKLEVVFEKAGYRTQTAEIESGVNNWLFGNILVGGLFGLSTDAYSGALNEYVPDHYLATLKADTPLAIDASPARAVRQLVVGFGPELRLEIASGAGSNLDALLKLAGVGDDARAQTLPALRRLSASTGDDLELGGKIVELYGLQ